MRHSAFKLLNTNASEAGTGSVRHQATIYLEPHSGHHEATEFDGPTAKVVRVQKRSSVSSVYVSTARSNNVLKHAEDYPRSLVARLGVSSKTVLEFRDCMPIIKFVAQEDNQ